jgi:long-chain fatty acid transport protein
MTHPALGRATLAVSLAAATLAPLRADATAFQLREGSATAMGSALAGRSANDRDISLIVHNPASLRGVDTFALSFGGAAIFADGDATATLTPGGQAAATALGLSNTDSPNENAIVPSFTVGWRASPQLIFGLAVDAPFGLASEYSSSFAGSFDGVRSELTTITATPMVAWEATPTFTVGGGVMIQYADAELQNFNGTGVQSIDGDGWDIGFTVGFILAPADGTQLGLTVQSGFRHRLDGGFSDNFTPPFLAGGSGTAAFELPPIVSLGLIQEITPRTRLMAEVEWTGWSVFDTIDISSDAFGPLPPDVQNYENSWMISLGGEYDVSDRLTVRAGAAYDFTPTRDADRTVRVPDGDRIWLAAGASYEITETIGVDASYLYIIVDDAKVTLRNGPTAGGVVNYDDGAVHLFSVNLRYAFRLTAGAGPPPPAARGSPARTPPAARRRSRRAGPASAPDSSAGCARSSVCC